MSEPGYYFKIVQLYTYRSTAVIVAVPTWSAAVNVEKKLQNLHTKTSQKDMAKLQICQLNLANYGSVRNFVSPNGG